jgi:hypothetical protein
MSASGLLPWLLVGALIGAFVTRDGQAPVLESCAETCSTSCELDVAGLGLTPEQIETLRATCAGAGKRLGASDAEAAELRRRLDAALDAEPVDENAVRELGRRLAGVRERRLDASLECVLGVRRVLNAEQMRELCARCGCTTRE